MTFQVDGARSVGNAGGGTKPIIARGTTSDGCPTFKVSHPKLQGDYRVKGRTLQVLDKKGVYQNASPQQRANLQNLRKTDVAFKNALAGPGNTALSAALDGGVGGRQLTPLRVPRPPRPQLRRRELPQPLVTQETSRAG